MANSGRLSLAQEIARLRNTVRWSIEGFAAAWRDEKSLRQWSGLNVVGWVLLGVVRFPAGETALLVALGAMVVVLELVNSAIEATVDYISTEQHPLAKKAKDVASAAVAVSALAWGACWLILLLA
ncbi:diacylglycerol kinase [Roseicyclus persicicus]|uniref:Diacylglycerol kinase n=1 Tax=Roseicyclus persicicus TaxID=2650661 RepID=A0A7X6GY95_9RHOB|nr:diacylglycerol kinase [Roseibacterium persicicum]NKX44553.1 diacylglycerol kinase [Roseibacterium persicicum]